MFCFVLFCFAFESGSHHVASNSQRPYLCLPSSYFLFLKCTHSTTPWLVLFTFQGIGSGISRSSKWGPPSGCGPLTLRSHWWLPLWPSLRNLSQQQVRWEAGCGLYQAHPRRQLPDSVHPRSHVEVGLELTTLMEVVS